MQPDRCMYLHLQDMSDDIGLDLVLSTEEDDFSAWWPAKYAMLEDKVKDDPAQQWYYDQDDGTLHNKANPDYFLENDLGWVMVAKQKGGKKKSKKLAKKEKDDDEPEEESNIQLRDDDDDDEDDKKKKTKSRVNR